MFSRFSTSWTLVKASAHALRSDRHLVIFPMLSGIAAIVISATFFIPAFMYEYARHGGHRGEAFALQSNGPGAYAITFLYYLILYFVMFFFNTALVGAAMIRLRGGSPTLGDGFRLALDRIGPIFGYALLSATVGVVLRTLSERLGLIGRIVIGIIGLAWNVATFLAVPVLVYERTGPIGAVKRSTQLLKTTWGEQIVGNWEIGTVTGLVALLIIVVGGVLGGMAAASEMFALAIAIGVITVLAVIAVLVIQAALAGIYTAALYLYAAEGVTPAGFDAGMIQSAFVPKGSRR